MLKLIFLAVCIASVNGGCSTEGECGGCISDHTCGWCQIDDGGYCTKGDMIGAFDLCNSTHAKYYYGSSCSHTLAYNPSVRATFAAAVMLASLFIALFGYRYIIYMLCTVSFLSTWLLSFVVLSKLYYFLDIPYSVALTVTPPILLSLTTALLTYLSYLGKLHTVFFKFAVFEMGFLNGVLLLAALLVLRVDSSSLVSVLSDAIDSDVVNFMVIWALCIIPGCLLGFGCVRGNRRLFIFCVASVGSVLGVLSLTILLFGITDDKKFLELSDDVQRVLVTHTDKGYDGEVGPWHHETYIFFALIWVLSVGSFFIQDCITARKGLRHLTVNEARSHQVEYDIDDHDLSRFRRPDPVTGDLQEMSLQDTGATMGDNDSDSDTMDVIRSARTRVSATQNTPGALRALAAVGLYNIDYTPVPQAKIRKDKKKKKKKKAKKDKKRKAESSSSSSSSEPSEHAELTLEDLPISGDVRYALLTKVEVGYEEGTNIVWYPAEITGYNCDDKTYAVRYATGEVSYGVVESYIRDISPESDP